MGTLADEEAAKPCIQDKIRSVYNRILKYIKKWDFVILILIISPLLYTRKPYEYISHFIFFTFVIFIDVKIIDYFSTRYKFDWSKASERELNAEDNVLLKGIGLFQVILFIYMGYIEDTIQENFYLQFIKLTIPIFIFIIYLIRGYAHIKNSPKYRTYSTLIIIYYLFIEISFITESYISSKLKILIGNVNLIEKYIFPYVVNFPIVSFIGKIRDALKIRYDY